MSTMLKLIIVDDEPDVIAGLRSVIDWSRLGIEVAGDASNSAEAMDLIREIRPDILMTDIRMPGPDGLALIESARRVLPDLAAIIFTGYSEFHYAKSAISLGVTEYLQKPISVDALELALAKAARAVAEARMARESRGTLARARRVVLEQELRDVLAGRITEDAEIGRVLRDAGLDAASSGGVVACVVGAQGSRAARALASAQVRETLQGGGLQTIALPSASESVILAGCRSEQQRLSDIVPCLEHARVRLEAEKLSAWIGVGTWRPEPAGARRSYQEAAEAARYAAFFGYRTAIVRIEQLRLLQEPPIPARSSAEAALLHLREGDIEGVREEVSQFLRALKEAPLSPDAIRHECLALVYRALRVASETGRDYLFENADACVPHRHINALEDFDAIGRWVVATLTDIMQWAAAVADSGYHRSINTVISHLRAHLSRGVTLKELADLVGMNPSYLSVLFRRETGVRYSEYLAKLRIERAKELLGEGFKVRQAARAVGYSSCRQFARVFRKHVGLTPGEYMAGKRSADRPSPRPTSQNSSTGALPSSQ